MRGESKTSQNTNKETEEAELSIFSHVWALNLAMTLTGLKMASRVIGKKTRNTALGECGHLRATPTPLESLPHESCSLQSIPDVWAAEWLRLQTRGEDTCGGKAALACCLAWEWTRLKCWSFTLLNAAEHGTSWCFGCLLNSVWNMPPTLNLLFFLTCWWIDCLGRKRRNFVLWCWYHSDVGMS